jgi:hypothetical protein
MSCLLCESDRFNDLGKWSIEFERDESPAIVRAVLVDEPHHFAPRTIPAASLAA